MTDWLPAMEAVERYAQAMSTYRGSRTGAALVGRGQYVFGCNRLLGDPAVWKLDPDARHNWFLHAEEDMLRRAQDRWGQNAAKGCTVVLNWFPCLPCAQRLVLAGVSEVVGLEPNWLTASDYDHTAALSTLEAEDVKVNFPLGTQAAWREAHDH